MCAVRIVYVLYRIVSKVNAYVWERTPGYGSGGLLGNTHRGKFSGTFHSCIRELLYLEFDGIVQALL